MSAILPTIRTARDLAKHRRLDGMVVIGFANGTFTVASYGVTKQQCRELAALVDFISEHIELGVVPLESLDTGGIGLACGSPPPVSRS